MMSGCRRKEKGREKSMKEKEERRERGERTKWREKASKKGKRKTQIG